VNGTYLMPAWQNPSPLASAEVLALILLKASNAPARRARSMGAIARPRSLYGARNSRSLREGRSP